MAQQADITVFDGAATPVSHLLKAISIKSEPKGRIVATWREQLPSVPIDASVRATMTLEQLNSGVYKMDLLVEVPVMESISGNNSAGYTAAPKVAYVNTLRTTGLFHPRSDVAGRRLARQILINLLGNISTSVAAATSGPAPDLFDNIIAVS